MPSSTSLVIESLPEIKHEEKPPIHAKNNTYIHLNLPAHDLEQLKILKTKHALEYLTVPDKTSLSTVQLKKIFNDLCTIEKNNSIKDIHEKLLLRNYKLAIIEATLDRLKKFKAAENEIEDKKQKQSSRLKRTLVMIGFRLLALSGMALDAAGSYLGIEQILLFFPFISDPVSITIAIALTAINSALFYSFEVKMLKSALDINTISEANSLLTCDDKEINKTNHINRLLLDSAKKMHPTDYKSISELTHCFNMNVTNKKSHYEKDYPEKKSHKFLRHSITALGAIMVTGGGLFLSKSLLASLGFSLTLMPVVGWSIIGFAMLTSLVFYLSMRGKAMVNMQNPAVQKFKENQKALGIFEPKYTTDFENHLGIEHAKDINNDLTRALNESQQDNKRLTKTILETHLDNRLKRPTPKFVLFQANKPEEEKETSCQTTSLITTPSCASQLP